MTKRLIHNQIHYRDAKASGVAEGVKTDLRGVGVEHHEAKFLRADAGEEDVDSVTGGHNGVEEGNSPLTGVTRTPAVILRTCTQSQRHSS